MMFCPTKYVKEPPKLPRHAARYMDKKVVAELAVSALKGNSNSDNLSDDFLKLTETIEKYLTT